MEDVFHAKYAGDPDDVRLVERARRGQKDALAALNAYATAVSTTVAYAEFRCCQSPSRTVLPELVTRRFRTVGFP